MRKHYSPSFLPVITVVALLAIVGLSGSNSARAQGAEPLRITCPPEQTNWICGVNSTAPVTYPAPATTSGNCSSAPTVTCSPPSGAMFILGTTTVTCTTTNRCGEIDSCTFRVTVARDTTPPVLECPANTNATLCGTGATVPVTYPTPTATDNADPNVTVVCTPSSGSAFPTGLTTVTCTAVDNCTNRTTCTFTVTVARDTTPPVIQCPANTNLSTCSAIGAVVSYPTPVATDNLDPNLLVTCTPASGSLFPVGTTTVTCTATDDCANRASCTFTVTVRPPLIFNGLCHSPLGLAALNVNTNDELEVTGFGSSGLDGVRIDLGQSQGLRWQTRLPDVDAADFVYWRKSFGSSTAGTEILLDEILLARTNGRLSVTPSAASYELKLLLRGEVVYRQGGRTGSFNLPVCTPVWIEECWENHVPEFPSHPLLPYCMSLLGLVCPVEMPGGPVQADALVVTPEDPLPPFTTLTAIQILGRNVPKLTLRQERLMMFGGEEQPPLPHHGLGQARLVARGDAGGTGDQSVTVSASTGLYGVAIVLDEPGATPSSTVYPVIYWEVDLNGLELAVGSEFKVAAHVRMEGGQPTFLGDLSLSKPTPTELVFRPECAIFWHRVEVGIFLAGAPAGGATLPVGVPVATLTADRAGMPRLIGVTKLASPPFAFALKFDVPGTFTLPDATRLTGDEIRVLAFGPMDGTAELTKIDLMALGIESFTITDEIALSALALVCPPSLTVRRCSTNAEPVLYTPPTVRGGTCSQPATVVCVPPSGSLFPPGVTTVTCTATNACGERAVCDFTVTVIDTLVYQSEGEPNNALASAKDLGWSPSFVAVTGRISPAGDVDYYRFTAGPNSKAWITVDTGGAAWAGANSRDSILTLYNGAGVAIESDDNDGSGNGADSVLESGDASAIAGAALAGGTYYLSVTAPAGAIIAPYRLYVTVTTNAIPAEVEPNSTAATATALVPAGLNQGVRNATLQPFGDQDWYSVSIAGPSLLHISVDGDPERDGVGTDTRVELFRQNGVMILFSANSSAGGGAVAEGFVYRLSIPGTYYVRVRSAATASGTGTYRVMVAHCALPPTAGLGIVHSGGRLTLSWPAAHEPSLLRSSHDLRTWSFLDLTPTAIGDELRVELPSSRPHQFFQLIPAGGWSNDTFHCCDANGQNCDEPATPFTSCGGGILVYCTETLTDSGTVVNCVPVPR